MSDFPWFSVSKAKLNEYSDKINKLAARLAPEVPDDAKAINEIKEEHSPEVEQVGSPVALSSGLRRRLIISQVEAGQTVSEKQRDVGAPIRLDATAQAHIEKYRKLQEDLTDEMVELVHQLKESSLMMNQSVQDTGKILDSTERAVEHSLAGTGRANARAVEVYSLTSKTTCFQWFLLFIMACMFVMVVLLIRIT
ncbi:uncharacterized protein LOC133901593 isoform X3 [Phragmites australis]|uniref:uncharacterized protein LOC133901593 isoform X3 n=1 Tax=Phragmites australis TaxID=29695 RepID=UPI002D78DFD4|nr:uncharacterized protein LOC133901593 isoform X3 [Phragmites australis]XP_062198993.1 uncharacterized protein LOC133901593 isoform X3 [Phragmites australis]